MLTSEGYVISKPRSGLYVKTIFVIKLTS
nr:hypothetical protein [Paenibacillus solani]